ncbi:MAG: ABC transporter ATP-binding protein [Desulfobacterales bacterium]
MSMLEVAAVGKSYRKYSSELKRVLTWFNLPFKPIEEHWVLQNISFHVQTGEAVGIVGQNGAGKSTLLKMITGIVQPSSGAITVTGRIAAILELGMGFNPEFTGRRNAFHGLSMMGFSRTEIKQVMPELEDFADIGAYFDEPVRAYSSGMQVRVAFAVATAFRPDLLIVDEALAVGDAAFQRKCFQRIETFQDAGTALLYVSHEIESIKKICDSAIYIKEGRLKKRGTAKEVCDVYEKDIFADSNSKASDESKPGDMLSSLSVKNDCSVSYGDGRAHINNIWLEDESHQKVNTLTSNGRFGLNYTVLFNQAVSNPVFAVMVKTKEGISLFGTDTEALKVTTGEWKAGDCLKIHFKLNNSFAPGTYYLNCGIKAQSAGKQIFIHRKVDAHIFEVRSSDNTTALSGVIDLYAGVEIERIRHDL